MNVSDGSERVARNESRYCDELKKRTSNSPKANWRNFTRDSSEISLCWWVGWMNILWMLNK